MLLWVLGGLVVAAAGVGVYAYTRGSLSSSASSLPNVPENQRIIGRITGQVRDEKTKKVIGGASAVANFNPGTQRGTVGVTSGKAGSDGSGVFQIQGMSSGDYSVKVSATGYKSKTIPTPPNFKACNFVKTIYGVNNDNCNFGWFDLTPVTMHMGCTAAKACVITDGIGVEECNTNADCANPTHAACDGAACVSAPGVGENTCSTNADCAAAIEHGGFSGAVKLWNGTSFALYKCTTPVKCPVTFNLNGEPYSGMVSTSGTLIKSTAVVDGHPDYFVLPVGTYTPANIKLLKPAVIGDVIYTGVAVPASIVIKAGELTNPLEWDFKK